MKTNLDELLQKRQSILLQMQAVDRLRRGSLSEQFFKSGAARRGPYYVLQGFFRSRKFAERVPPEQAERVRRDVENYRGFQTLAEEFVTLSDQITRLYDQAPDGKKNSSRRRPPPGSFGKPPPS